MHASVYRFLFVLLALSSVAGQAAAQRKTEPLADQVKRAIDRGTAYLRQTQRNDGSWEVNLENVNIRGGWSGLAILALLNSGVPVDDPMVAKGLAYLRTVNPNMTYVRALQTMVYAEAGLVEDKERIAHNVKWLIDARIEKDGQLQGWTYGQGPGVTTDNSNTQYALLGLYAGHVSGAHVPNEIWYAIRSFYVRTQQDDGGWLYSPKGGLQQGSSLTMTVAGLCGQFMTDLALRTEIELDANGKPKKCGEQQESDALARAQAWLSRPGNFRIDLPQRTFYNLYGLERAGRLSGYRFLAGHDWYREGCEYLVRNQMQEGSWSLRGAWDQWEVVSTSFALLFLSKGRTPVLMSKLVHGNWPRRTDDTDWSRRPHDARHLTEFCAKNLFTKKQPLAWQVFDLMRGATPRPGFDTLTEDDLNEVTSDLLQSPIVYITGEDSPLQRFSGVERDLLKRYVENGGFILVEACEGSPAFDAGFKELCKRLWPENPLEDLPAGHPIWLAHYRVSPGQPFKLMGIQMGCKTVLVYSPQDISCLWDSNNTTIGHGKTAFELGANIVAYATGMEPPKPRLTEIEVARDDGDPRQIPRGYFKVAQIKHRGDWQPAPNAMRNLMSHVRTLTGMDVVLKTETLPVYVQSVVDFKFLYMHGRADFQFADEELKNLRFNLENGGLLLADACCGAEAYDKAFRRFAAQLFPKLKLEEVPPDDVLYSKELNRTAAITNMNTKCRRERGAEMRNVAPLLEGIKINNRWVLLYSKYDLGCALERHNASDCLGYDHESAKRIASAAVLYLFEP